MGQSTQFGDLLDLGCTSKVGLSCSAACYEEGQARRRIELAAIVAELKNPSVPVLSVRSGFPVWFSDRD